MEKIMLWRKCHESTFYIKFLITSSSWGIGITLELADGWGWELTAQIGCFQMWIGG